MSGHWFEKRDETKQNWFQGTVTVTDHEKVQEFKTKEGITTQRFVNFVKDYPETFEYFYESKIFENSLQIFVESEKVSHDKCLFIYSNKDSFIGKVIDGKRAYGKMMYANNDTYEGEWLENVFHGKGTMTYADGRKPITANWINGYVSKKVDLEDEHGNKYSGQASVIDGITKKNGEGAMLYKNGNMY